MMKMTKIYCLLAALVLFISCNNHHSDSKEPKEDGMELAMRQEFIKAPENPSIDADC